MEAVYPQPLESQYVPHVKSSSSNTEFITIWFWKKVFAFLGEDLVFDFYDSDVFASLSTLSWVIFKSLIVYLFWPIDWFSLWVTESTHPDISMNIFANLRKCDRCYRAYTERLKKLETKVASGELTDAVVSFFNHKELVQSAACHRLRTLRRRVEQNRKN